MARTKISKEHEEAAAAQVRALAAVGIEATTREVLLAAFISNAIETTVALVHVGTDSQPARPELDTPMARKMFETAGSDAATAVRCLAIARALLRARSPSISLEKQAHHIAQGLLELFAALEADAVPSASHADLNLN